MPPDPSFGNDQSGAVMRNLLFFRRSCAYRYAACAALHEARMLPRGAERNQLRKRAKALRDLAHDEAWLEGQIQRMHGNDRRFGIAAASPERVERAHRLG